MAQGYYALEEAAKILNMPSDELKQMARKGEIRAFQDRGTWRFRIQDIQELARQRGIGSEPELVLGEALPPQPTDSPAPRQPSKSREEEVFDFNLAPEDDDIGVGADLFHGVPTDIGMGPHSDGPKSGPKSGGTKTGGPLSGSKIAGPKSPVSKGPKIAGPKSPVSKGSKIAGPKSPVSKGGPLSPPPHAPGSDSDVRLVADGSDINFELASGDSGVGLGGPKSSGPKSSGPKSAGPRSSKLGAPKSKTGMGSPAPARPSQLDTSKKSSKVNLERKSSLPPSEPKDSGVRLVPMDSDSDVKIVSTSEDESVPLGKQPPLSATDSDIRLEHDLGQRNPAPPSSGEGQLTEEINLDEELRQAESQPPSGPMTKPRPSSKLNFPTQSPFELSEPDINLPEADDSSVVSSQFKKPEDSSSDFELTPAGESSSPIDPGSEEFSLEVPDETVELGESPPAHLKGRTSGISLENPADSGISLEQGGDGSSEIEFELNLDAESTPKPSPAESSSEFELTLDEAPAAEDDEASSSSEFELTLDENAGEVDSTSSEFELTLEEGDQASLSDSDSEFELTLDDSGGLSPLAEEGEEKDIFETDIEVPSLEEESGSQAVAVDDEETSDFDLALDDSDAGADEESGSEAIALDDEDEEDQPRKKAKPKTKAKGKTRAKVPTPALDDEELGGSLEDIDFDGGDITVDEDEDADAPVREVVRERIIRPAPWGAVPVIFMVPCVAVMFMVVIMGFELIQSLSGYKAPGLFTRTVGNMILPENQKFKN